MSRVEAEAGRTVLTCLDGLGVGPPRCVGSSGWEGNDVPEEVVRFAVAEVPLCDAVLDCDDGILVGRLAELASAGLGFARFLGPMSTRDRNVDDGGEKSWIHHRMSTRP